MNKKILNLLILEDSPADTELEVEELENAGFVIDWKRVETEKDFKKALKEKPDLILADYTLPSFTGTEAIKIQQELNPDIPLIIISGTVGEEQVVECMKAGAVDYVMKDKLSHLGTVVKRALKEADEQNERKRAEKALKESEQELNAIFNGAGEGIALLDKTGKILRINKYITEIGGYAEEELVGKRFNALKMFTLKSMSKMITVFGKLLKGQEITYEAEVSTKKGEKKIIQVRNSILKKDGKVEGVIVILRDITERKKAKESLKVSEDKYRELINTSVDGAISIDSQMKVDVWNKGAEKIFGYTREKIIGQSIMKIVPERYKKAMESGFAKFQKSGSGHILGKIIEIDGLRKDGKEIPVELSVSSRKVGEAYIATAIVRDITERKKAENLLKKAEKKYRNLFEKSEDAILIIHNRKFVDCNQATISMLGYNDKDEFLNTHPSELSPEKQPDGKMSFTKANEMMEIAIKKGSHRFEWDHKKSGGEVFLVEVLLTAISTDKDNQIIHTVWRDITERKKAEEIRLVLYNIANAVNTTTNLDELYKIIHKQLGKIIDTTNFYIANYNEETGEITAPFFVDEMFDVKPPIKLRPKGFTAYIIRNKKSLFLTEEKREKLIELGDITKREWKSNIWLGVPLIIENRVVGALAILSYRQESIYTKKDLSLLEFVSNQIAIAIARKQTEESLKASEQKYRQLAETAKDVIMVLDLKGNVKYVNQEGIDLCGYSKEEILKMNIKDVLSEDKIPLSDENFEKRIAGDKSLFMYEIDFFNKKGNKIPVEIKSSLITEQGKPAGILIIARDITERKQVQEELHKRLNDLETFNRISVGRELRMIDLKKEINEILVKSGKEAKYKIAE